MRSLELQMLHHRFDVRCHVRDGKALLGEAAVPASSQVGSDHLPGWTVLPGGEFLADPSEPSRIGQIAVYAYHRQLAGRSLRLPGEVMRRKPFSAFDKMMTHPFAAPFGGMPIAYCLLPIALARFLASGVKTP